MGSDQAGSSRYLVEWYTPRLHGRAIADVANCLRRSLASAAVTSQPTKLLYAVEVPMESYAFGVFAADSADIVAQLCRSAGLPADRVTAAVEAPTDAGVQSPESVSETPISRGVSRR